MAHVEQEQGAGSSLWHGKVQTRYVVALKSNNIRRNSSGSRELRRNCVLGNHGSA